MHKIESYTFQVESIVKYIKYARNQNEKDFFLEYHEYTGTGN